MSAFDLNVKQGMERGLSREEAEARATAIQEDGRRFALAYTAVLEHAQGKRGITGVVRCPVCESGDIDYRVASSNGHVWAACTTKGCVSWMQ